MLLLIIVLAIVGIDIVLYTNSYENDTISHVIKTWVNKRGFFLVFLWGALAGRFFLGKAGDDLLGAIMVLAIAGILFLAATIFKWRVTIYHKVLLFVSGVGVSHFFWSFS